MLPQGSSLELLSGWISEREEIRASLARQSIDRSSRPSAPSVAVLASSPADAEGQYRRAVDCDRVYAAAHKDLGSLLDRQRRSEDALVSLRQAIALDSSNSQALYNLAQVLLRLGRDDEAVAALKQVEAIHRLAHEEEKRVAGADGLDS